jgi:preprotein translocase subunit SecA
MEDTKLHIKGVTIMLEYLKKALGDTNERKLKKYYKIVEQINNLEDTYSVLSDDELKAKTTEFKNALSSGKTVEDIRVDAFAVVREASKRILGMRHFDVQLLGGLVLTEGNIAEMATGEGKTLVASLPSYLRALEGKGVHVITVNDYLAKRDREIIGQIHEFLGLTVGLNLPMMEPADKKNAYLADITYGVGTEFGFDYLRDNMAGSLEERVQRPYHFAIIDEVDSVLIDEAKTPLIIAGKMKSSADLHNIAARVAKKFELDRDYLLDEETKATSLTDEGIEKVEKAFGIDNLYELEHLTLYHYVIQAVRAHVLFKNDVDYIIQDGKIKLVDMFTGRIMEGRTLSDGLHQAIEAKEGLDITDENKTQASITIQNYFRMYPLLSGMTGTAKTEEKEFEQVYGMEVIQIPTNRPIARVDMPDLIFKTTKDKYTAVTKEVKERHSKGQPVLVGTTSILQSEEVAKYFKEAGLEFEILNAKSVEQEVHLISQAGQKGHITIATNMAGRGTDILLGEGVAELGGLHVLGTERHESRRIDNQLKGRAGRQGDPGSSQFMISLEDDMFRRFAKEELEKLSSKITTVEGGLVTNKTISEFVDRVQRIVEGANFSMREYNLKLDDVINEQRNIIYSLRNKLLANENLTEQLVPMIQSTINQEIENTCNPNKDYEEWPLKELATLMEVILTNQTVVFPDEETSPQGIFDIILEQYNEFVHLLENLPEDKKLQYNRGLNFVMTSVIDYNWIQHIEQMTRLKEGIGLRAYQQEDPMRLYQRDAVELFTDVYYKIEKEISIGSGNLLREILKQ